MENCYKYKELIKSDELEEVINNPTQNRVNTSHKAAIKNLVKKTKQKIKGKKPKEYDQLLYKDFHKTFKNLPMKILRDIRFWNYLGFNDFHFLIEKRWGKASEKNKKRYIGTQTKGGFSRHAIARLFWMGEQPFITAPYKMNDIMIEKQDPYTQLTELILSLSPNISESLIKNLKNKAQSEAEFRASVKKVSRTGGTKLIYAMKEADVAKIIK